MNDKKMLGNLLLLLTAMIWGYGREKIRMFFLTALPACLPLRQQTTLRRMKM